MSSPEVSGRSRAGADGRSAAARAVEAAWRIEWPKLVAGLTRLVGDIATAEEFAQDAHLAALEQWPRDGIPPNPGGWLMLTAKHRAIDRIRRDATFARKLPMLGHDLLTEQADEQPADDIDDDLLRMVFTACHPALSQPARVALTLRMVGGLTTDEIARAYLVPETTVAQRIVRAKRTIAEKKLPYEVPSGPQLDDRLESVLEVVYLIFNEGYAATSGENWVRAELCDDALRLARILTGLMPREPEAFGLAALLELQASRTGARSDATKQLVLLPDQDRSRWDQLSIRRGFAALGRAHNLAMSRGVPPGRYALQGAIAAAHAMAATSKDTDWRRIAGLYAVLAERFPSPVVEVNRAVAVAMVHGPAAGLDLVDAVAATGTLDSYHLLYAVRAHFLAQLDRPADARAAYLRAAALTANAAEQALLRERADRLD
ncbi:RNA polymerase sigma factor [Nocardia africana]|uniref:RNA polymerase sigma factor n=1 Tax=Nocardia africana TaxID=134964 RepID=A0A378WXT6_9NOCA|nr:RNA polymerase sigma factor [Nocardia africana]MCC3312621.1 RNA polymerase sigma factor [Nocardia africana]SUA46058.1 RNA polymerase sigma factor [Nocardia africana]